MRLEEIGFYTMTDERARTASATSRLGCCELLVTDACNFKCPYCRGCKPEYHGTVKTSEALKLLEMWCDNSLQSVRFSGGEPTLHRELPAMVAYCKARGVQHIKISTNGSARQEIYDELLAAGANDFGISLDACCAQRGDEMAGGIHGAWRSVVSNIEYLSGKTYVTVGVVLNEANVSEMAETVKLAHDLGVADIRVISAAQWNQPLNVALEIPEEILAAHPILRFRVNKIRSGRGVRGLAPTDNHHCPLVLDDMAVIAGRHFPCIIYLREGGAPIGEIGPKMWQERAEWTATHDVFADPICHGNCLDFCVEYNNRYRELHEAP